MSSPQNINLSVSGVYTSVNDYNGLPPGALNVADNVECRYKNVMEPRRGFEGLLDSAVFGIHFIRLTNFFISGTDRLIGLGSDFVLYYYDGSNPWPIVPGSHSSNILPPDPIFGKSRFTNAGQNLYITAVDGIRSLSSGSAATMLRAGVPKALNIESETDPSSTSGFFENNNVLTTTGTLNSGSAIITALASTSGVAIDQYVTGIEVPATRVIQDLTYTSNLFGASGNAISITYVGGGALSVGVVGNAITVTLNTGVSTATQVKSAIDAFGPSAALVTVVISGTAGTVQVAAALVNLTGGLDNTIPDGTKVLSISTSATLVVQTGNTTIGSATITNLPSLTGITAGVLVSGTGIPAGASVVSTSGAGPFNAVLTLASFQLTTGTTFTFSSPVVITMDGNATATLSGTPITFYAGAQVGYRVVFGRVETDIDSGTITRLGAPSPVSICNNTSPYSKDVIVTATLPKNSSDEITFFQLYRSTQTSSIEISPLDQYNLVYERALVPADFTARSVTVIDSVTASLVGIPLYTGSDQEGALQANDPPPSAWDMGKFRDFTMFGNITRPTTLSVSILAVGAPNGIQVNDTITIAGTFAGVAFSRVFTAKGTENAALGEFEVFSAGTTSQDITDTANSLIRVVNYDNACPVHAILLSSTTDLPGQILFEADQPNYDTFSMVASLHTSAYDPPLVNLTSEINTINNGLAVSKSGEMEAVPSTNLYRVGDSSSDIIRTIPLRDYVIILKGDGIYKASGTTPNSLVISPFDLTTKIIGADTAVSLNSGVWMLSNQGVVSISDGGVDAKSIPIDDQLNQLIGTYLDNLTDVSFAVGYESDRKYILSVPDSINPYTVTQHCYNYVTNAWTSWSRQIFSAFIHSVSDKLHISRADVGDASISKERKAATYKDFVDEGVSNTIVSVNGNLLVLASVTDVEEGDILYQATTLFSPILDVNPLTNVVTLQYTLSFTPGLCTVLGAYECTMTWKQVFGDNPAFVRQYPEGVGLFKNTRFNVATASFVTDYSQSEEEVELIGTGNALWGLFPWGLIPWGGALLPQKLRFYIPQGKQLGSYLIPTLKIKQGYSDFKFQGLAIQYHNVSPEVGL